MIRGACAAFPDVNTSQQLVSVAGGTQPRWSPNGAELFYLAEDGRMMAAPASPLFLGDYFRGDATVNGRTYDVAPDGRFLMLTGSVWSNQEVRMLLDWWGRADQE